ncbi:MAG TPA: hypothetical protein VLM05_09305 [Mycobacteriales bacterium]|nr:hypothetical protein [Mycobacteriales bacterium]
MDNVTLAFEAAWKVLVVGVLLGAGLPALFATGVRSLAYGPGGDAEVGAGAHRAGRVLAGICFVVVAAAVVLGITYIVATGFGKVLSFEHVYPTLRDKK